MYLHVEGRLLLALPGVCSTHLQQLTQINQTEKAA